MRELIRAENLTRAFAPRGLFARGRSVQAVNDVSLTVARGEVVGLVGESGSGKSTIGRLLLGLMPPSSGHVRLEGGRFSPVARCCHAPCPPTNAIGVSRPLCQS